MLLVLSMNINAPKQFAIPVLFHSSQQVLSAVEHNKHLFLCTYGQLFLLPHLELLSAERCKWRVPLSASGPSAESLLWLFFFSKGLLCCNWDDCTLSALPAVSLFSPSIAWLEQKANPSHRAREKTGSSHPHFMSCFI